MYRLRVKKTFAAAHFIPGYNGKCKNLHGHNWAVEAFFIGSTLDENGLLIDFKKIKEKLGEVLEKLDHTNLNDHNTFKTFSPSCENIAYYIYSKLIQKIQFNNVRLERVRVWESENAYVEIEY